jgi:flagellar hook-length control protein FliK
VDRSPRPSVADERRTGARDAQDERDRPFEDALDDALAAEPTRSDLDASSEATTPANDPLADTPSDGTLAPPEASDDEASTAAADAASDDAGGAEQAALRAAQPSTASEDRAFAPLAADAERGAERLKHGSLAVLARRDAQAASEGRTTTTQRTAKDAEAGAAAGAEADAAADAATDAAHGPTVARNGRAAPAGEGASGDETAEGEVAERGPQSNARRSGVDAATRSTTAEATDQPPSNDDDAREATRKQDAQQSGRLGQPVAVVDERLPAEIRAEALNRSLAAKRSETTSTESSSERGVQATATASTSGRQGSDPVALAPQSMPDLPGAKTADDADPAAKLVGRGLAALAQQKGGSMMMRLDPPSLGDVKIHLVVHAGRVVADLVASNPEARTLLAADLGQLRAALESQGLVVDRLTVQGNGAQQRSEFQQSQSQTQSQPQSQPQPAAAQQQQQQSSSNNDQGRSPSDQRTGQERHDAGHGQSRGRGREQRFEVPRPEDDRRRDA